MILQQQQQFEGWMILLAILLCYSLYGLLSTLLLRVMEEVERVAAHLRPR